MGLQELFVETIAKDAYCCAQQGKRKTLQRRDLDNAIEAVDEFAFLEGNNMSPSPEAEQMPAPCSWTSKTAMSGEAKGDRAKEQRTPSFPGP
ncbi:DNA polymerase epsilon subunit 4 isoform X5 [Lepus europaeus]|uniref:DNA polymerase epsilon subunit 4 isoform X5 n=1 Tax=Lepus europaeus TaxID=9983 RepID=UPI002B46D591|nr:DNA polymerase epsilon subunit 4 isoform X5 [Lepus europaeus]